MVGASLCGHIKYGDRSATCVYIDVSGISMLHHSPKVQALILLSIFLTGGVVYPLAHRMTHGPDGHEWESCEHDTDVGLHFDQQTAMVSDGCLQCVRHTGLFSDHSLVAAEFRAADSVFTLHQSVPGLDPVSGQSTRGPPVASA